MEYGVHIYVVNFKVNLLSENCKMCFEHDLTTKQYYVYFSHNKVFSLFVSNFTTVYWHNNFFYLKQKTSSVIASTKRFRE